MEAKLKYFYGRKFYLHVYIYIDLKHNQDFFDFHARVSQPHFIVSHRSLQIVQLHVTTEASMHAKGTKSTSFQGTSGLKKPVLACEDAAKF